MEPSLQAIRMVMAQNVAIFAAIATCCVGVAAGGGKGWGLLSMVMLYWVKDFSFSTTVVTDDDGDPEEAPEPSEAPKSQDPLPPLKLVG